MKVVMKKVVMGKVVMVKVGDGRGKVETGDSTFWHVHSLCGVGERGRAKTQLPCLV